MSRLKTVYRCTDCGGASPKWLGRCQGCGAWNSLIEEVDQERALVVAPVSRPVLMADVDLGEWSTRPTGIGELDRVLGGGLVPGSVTLLGGEPGIGKSTLVLQALATLAASGARCLLVSAEESRQQVRLRAERLGALPASLWLVGETVLPSVIADI